MVENKQDAPGQSPSPESEGSYLSRITRAQWGLVGLALIMATGMLAYYGLYVGKFQKTALMFVGLPALLAILFTLLPRPKSPIWMAMKGTTIALCLSAIVLGEGVPCVVMAAPLFYLMAYLVATAYERGRKAGRENTVRVMMILPLLVLSLEGTHDSFTFPRVQQTSVESTIFLKPTVFEERLRTAFAFGADQPLFLRLFTTPAAMTGSGLNVGDERKVRFRGPGKHRGVLHLRVTERADNRVKFQAVSDTTKIGSWMGWRTAEVTWGVPASDAGVAGKPTLRVTWTFSYERRLDPAWYFAPIQSYAVKLSGAFLTDNLAY